MRERIFWKASLQLESRVSLLTIFAAEPPMPRLSMALQRQKGGFGVFCRESFFS